MKFLVTFTSHNDIASHVVKAIYGIEDSFKSGLIEDRNLKIPNVGTFVGAADTHADGSVKFDVDMHDFISKEYGSYRDFIENEGRYLVLPQL